MYSRIGAVLNLIFSTIGIIGVSFIFLAMATEMDFVDIGVICLVLGCYLGVSRIIGLRLKWSRDRRRAVHGVSRRRRERVSVAESPYSMI